MSQKNKQCGDDDAFKCTQKCVDALDSKTGLRSRSRQYCLLLTRGDAVSFRISQQLGAKVDMSQLIEDGYIQSGLFNPKNPAKPLFTYGSLVNVSKPKVINNNVFEVQNKPQSTNIKTCNLVPNLKSHSINIEASDVYNEEGKSTHVSPMLQFATGLF